MLHFSVCVTHEFLRVLQSDWRRLQVRSCKKPVKQLYQTLFLTQRCTIKGKGLARQTSKNIVSEHFAYTAQSCVLN